MCRPNICATRKINPIKALRLGQLQSQTEHRMDESSPTSQRLFFCYFVSIRQAIETDRLYLSSSSPGIGCTLSTNPPSGTVEKPRLAKPYSRLFALSLPHLLESRVETPRRAAPLCTSKHQQSKLRVREVQKTAIYRSSGHSRTPRNVA